MLLQALHAVSTGQAALDAKTRRLLAQLITVGNTTMTLPADAQGASKYLLGFMWAQ
jgi:hypothetical protein